MYIMIISWVFRFKLFAIIINLFIVRTALTLEFKDITNDVFADGHYSGIIAAFGDFNADKLTDLFCIQRGYKTLEILLSNSSEPYFGQTSMKCYFPSTITGITPGDFNGDSMIDVMVSLQENSEKVNIVVLWGFLDRIVCSNETVFILSGQPFIFDYNDDMIVDIMGEDESRNRSVWISNTTSLNHFTKVILSDAKQYLRTYISSAVVDLNNDLVSDVIVTGKKNFELWIKVGDTLQFQNTLEYPKNTAVFGQSTFVDFNTDSLLDHIMPVCYFDNGCKSSAIVIWDRHSSWISLLDDFKFEGSTWGFYIDGRTLLDKAALPITLRSGDFNMDGYPDFIVVLQNKAKKDQTRAVIFENIPCSNCTFGRTLMIHWNVPGLSSMQNAQIAAFYDIFEDGTMDILISSKVNNEWQIHALKNMDTYDAYFIKVLVLSGLCYSHCPSGRVPYGANQPGPMVSYNTTKPNGEALVSSAVQMPQSAHFPLHLPYTVFGLGQTPNFVDHLTVAIPEMTGGRIHKREWTQIIPNSQMVVIPYPPEEEKHWVNKLFLTPSHLVVLTCIALIGTCIFIALIIFFLHWQERREDRKEKMQEAYRFPFDAM